MTDNALNRPARIAICNFWGDEYLPRLERINYHLWVSLVKDIGVNFLNLTFSQAAIDKSSTFRLSPVAKKNLASFILDEEKENVIIFLEFLLENAYASQYHFDGFGTDPSSDELYDWCHDSLNSIFEEHGASYKVIGTKIVSLTNEEEALEIEQAKSVPYANVKIHIEKAARYLYAEEPDYANSIKESISAVESIAKELLQDEKAGLGDCIRVFKDKGITLHPAFVNALSALYGFASNEGGVRHGSHTEPLQVNQSTARFMLVVCSAYVNFIIANAPDGEE